MPATPACMINHHASMHTHPRPGPGRRPRHRDRLIPTHLPTPHTWSTFQAHSNLATRLLTARLAKYRGQWDRNWKKRYAELLSEQPELIVQGEKYTV
jgi:hypothetical protein